MLKEKYVLLKNLSLGLINVSVRAGSIIERHETDGQIYLLVDGERFDNYRDLDILLKIDSKTNDKNLKVFDADSDQPVKVSIEPAESSNKMKVVQSEHDSQGAEGKVVGTISELRAKHDAPNVEKAKTAETDNASSGTEISEGSVRGMTIVKGEDNIQPISKKKEANKLEIVNGDEEYGVGGTSGIALNDGGIPERTQSLEELRASASKGVEAEVTEQQDPSEDVVDPASNPPEEDVVEEKTEKKAPARRGRPPKSAAEKEAYAKKKAAEKKKKATK